MKQHLCGHPLVTNFCFSSPKFPGGVFPIFLAVPSKFSEFHGMFPTFLSQNRFFWDFKIFTHKSSEHSGNLLNYLPKIGEDNFFRVLLGIQSSTFYVFPLLFFSPRLWLLGWWNTLLKSNTKVTGNPYPRKALIFIFIDVKAQDDDQAILQSPAPVILPHNPACGLVTEGPCNFYPRHKMPWSQPMNISTMGTSRKPNSFSPH